MQSTTASFSSSYSHSHHAVFEIYPQSTEVSRTSNAYTYMHNIHTYMHACMHVHKEYL